MFGSGLGILQQAKHFPSTLSKSKSYVNTRVFTHSSFGQLLVHNMDLITSR